MKRMAAFLMALAAGACLSTTAMAAPQGQMVFARGGWVTTLDPHVETSFVLTETLPYIFDTLLTKEIGTGKIIPHLAESHQFVTPTALEMKLRKGVKFSNGEPVNAEAVKFSIDRIQDPKNKSRQAVYIRSVKSVEVVDEYTVRIHTKDPDAIIESILAGWVYIAPPKYYSQHAAAYLSRNPVGSGPYTLVSWKRRQEIVLEAKPDYWKPGVPKIKRAIIKEVPEAATRIAGLLSGAVDIADRIPPQMVARIRANSNLEVVSYPIPRVAYVKIFVKEGPLTDMRVRQALNYAVDKQKIIQSVLDGYARQVALLQVPQSFGYHPGIKPYPYDPEKAKKLLAEAGYPKGFEVDLVIPVGRYHMGERVTEAVSGYLEKVGVRTTVKPVEWGSFVRTLVRRWRPEVKPFLQFAARYDTPLDCDWMMEMITARGSYSLYDNPQLNPRIDLARATVDKAKRLDMYLRLNEELKELAPFIFLHQEMALYGKKRGVVFPQSYDGQFRFHAADIGD